MAVLRDCTSYFNKLLKLQVVKIWKSQHRNYTKVNDGVTPVLSWLTLSKHGDKIGFVNCNDGSAPRESFTFDSLFTKSSVLSKKIRNVLNIPDMEIDQENVAFLCPNNSSYLVTLLGCWLSGCAAVPLCKSHPLHTLEYYVKDSSASLLIGTPEYKEQIEQLASKFMIPHVIVSEGSDEAMSENERDRLNKVPNKSRALILYTSGTTGPPKGVVLTHGNLRAQVDSIASAWKMSATDTLLHCLPLHHLHGVLNALLVPLSVGGSVVMMPTFDANEVWKQLTTVARDGPTRINTFMAVPTIYVKLLSEYDTKFKGRKITEEFIRAMCLEKIRLMVSGSSALPEPIFEKWEQVTGHRLLERFGMTEIGMGLTNPLIGERRPGFVGNPLPNVRARIVKSGIVGNFEVLVSGNEYESVVAPGKTNESGELEIQGPSVFHEYWMKPDATKSAFSTDGWFKTGDVAQYVNGGYKILGRASVDILKSGGFKISALDVENQLLCHEEIAECAVVGLADITWGQKVAAVIVLRSISSELTSEKIREWAKTRLPHYSVPSVIKIVTTLPRSPIGKINKKDLVKLMFPESF